MQLCLFLGSTLHDKGWLVQKQGRFEVYEGDAQPPMSPPVGQGQQFMEQNLGSKPTTPEHGS